MRASSLLALAFLLLLGCPPSEEEERRAATLAFLRADPTPSSIAVLQPGVAAKLAEVEPTVRDPVQRDRIVVALVLDDTDDSRLLLLELLEREPDRTPVAFDTARRFDRLTGYLHLLHEHLDGPVREDVFLDVCWPMLADAAASDGDRAPCLDLWGAEPAGTQLRWMRLASQRGPHDDATPYRTLERGLATEAAEPWAALVERVEGGEVLPADPVGRDRARLEAVIDERNSRRAGRTVRARTVAFEGGYVELVPPAADSELGRLGGAIADAAPASCVAPWGEAVRRGGLLLEVRLEGSRAPPVVVAVDTDEAAVHGDEPGPSTEHDEQLRGCVEQALVSAHEAGEASWVPRAGKTRVSVRAHRGQDPASIALLGDDDLTEGELRALADALRVSGSDEWLARLADREPTPIRDLGAHDLGFCLVYTAAGWDDCAVWIGELAREDDALASVLRKGLGDADPAARALCHRALSVVLDEESLAAAAARADGDDDDSAGEGDTP